MKLTKRERNNMRRVYRLLADCTVLLKKNGAFPLKQAGPVALYGSGARHTVTGGTGSGEVNSRFTVSAERGLAAAGFTVTTGAWLDAYDAVRAQAKTRFIAKIKAQAKAQHVPVFKLGMGAVMPEPEYHIPLDDGGEPADAAVYVLSRVSGEGSDRTFEKGDILLTDTEIRDILALNRRYERFMLVLNVGGPVDLSPVLEVGNILLLSQLGALTGRILADILLGKAAPSGKLATTWASAAQRQPLDFGGADEVRYREGVYAGYRYYDTFHKDVLFPFGYGLSYTEFAVRCESVKIAGAEAAGCGTPACGPGEAPDKPVPESVLEEDRPAQSRRPKAPVLTVTAVVRNTGALPGREVAQVYVTAPRDRLDKPAQVLADWKKTKLLQPGEAQTVEIPLDLRDIASFDPERSAYVLEGGDYLLRLGSDSRHTEVCGVLTLSRTVRTRVVRSAFGMTDFEDLRPGAEETEAADSRPASETATVLKDSPAAFGNRRTADTGRLTDADAKASERTAHAGKEGLPRLVLDPAAFVTEIISYSIKNGIPEAVQALTTEELLTLNAGAHGAGGGLATVIGSAAKTVAGAAGATADLPEKGFPELVMADGPAGLRLSRKYWKQDGAAYGISGGLPGGLGELMPAWQTKLLKRLGKKPPKGARILTQYATAIPIGTALAQSFDPETARICGDVVGGEMERFGVHLWLAPALNLQRSIRCGRNFEYYSEDPLVSGVMAAAVTRGVQAHSGRGVTLKHFAANNQEHNRYQNNSMVSERALRELYLRGFEIAVREGAPAAVMSSYNLLNGVHTSERRDLLEDVLRSEFGFEGVVMTDWIVAMMTDKKAKYPAADAGQIAAAGGELVMPGSAGDVKAMRKALETGVLTEAQLRQNAARLYALAQRLRGKAPAGEDAPICRSR